MRRAALTGALITLLLAAIPAACFAQGKGLATEPMQSGNPSPAAAKTVEEPGFLTRMLAAVVGEQRKFHRQLSSAINDIRQQGSAAAAWTLIITSFLYGVFHAAGPGHGKAILTTYLVTHRQRMARGVLLAAAAAGVQGLTAIVLVFGLVELAGWASRDTQTAVRWAEQFSFALVALLGFYLLWRGFAGLRRVVGGGDGSESVHGPHCETDCGHAHMPTPEQTDAARDVKTAIGVVLSIGIRPCSGAVLVLAVANIFGILWAGLAAVLAMSIGTAIAVATLALLVVSARHWVSTVITGDGTRLAMAGQTVAMLGGTIILVLGLLLLAGSFGPSHPLGL